MQSFLVPAIYIFKFAVVAESQNGLLCNRGDYQCHGGPVPLWGGGGSVRRDVGGTGPDGLSPSPPRSADVIHLSSGEDDSILGGKPPKEEASEPSGAHTDDAFNRPDAQGRVLVNLNHPSEDDDIFLLPQLARAVKPHQVPAPPHLCPYVCVCVCFLIAFPRQIGGIRFLYDNLIESAERFANSSGFGCILAHSMGLGKTLQVISFIDVLFRQTRARTVLAIVPVSPSPPLPAPPRSDGTDRPPASSRPRL